jgi:hypothetical protein
MRDDSFVRGIRGPIGSGKTSACIAEILRRSAEQKPSADGVRRTRWAVIRNTYPELSTTTIKSWHMWVPSVVGRWQSMGPPQHRIVTPTQDMEVMFLALDRPDDIAKLLSLELTGAWINEAREVPKAVLDGLTGRVGRYPAMIDGGASWSGIFMDTNAPDTDHWWYRLAEEDRPDGFRFFSQPSGLAPDAENIANLPAQYYQRTMAGKDDDWIRIYVHGQYGYVQDGKPVYPEYSDSIHCRDDAPVLLGARVYRGWDWGLTPACVWGQILADGRFHVFDEMVADNTDIHSFGKAVLEHHAIEYPAHRNVLDIGDPAGMQRSPTAKPGEANTCFEVMRGMGIHIEPGDQALAIRIGSVKAVLKMLTAGKPRFVLHSRCRNLRKGFQGKYQYRRMRITGDERYHDVPDKNSYSHPHDALQYMAARIFGAALKGRQDIRPTMRPARVLDAEMNY